MKQTHECRRESIFKALGRVKIHIKKENGEVNTIAIILISIAVIAVVAIFKERLIDLVNVLFDKVKSSPDLK